MHNFSNIGIAGIGLIGGSFAGAFNKLGKKIYAYDINKSVLIEASNSGKFEAVTDNFTDFINFPLDLIYVCLPVNIALSFLENLSEHNYKGYITDGCSTKSSLFKLAETLELNYCGGHPIRGKEKSGFSAAEDDLFNNALHIIVPSKNDDLNKTLIELHSKIGMKIKLMSAKEHDKIFANVSHLPHLISFCLMDTVLRNNKEALSYVGGGFLDFTRIAASDPAMWRDVFLDNKEELLAVVTDLEETIKEWKNTINNNDSGKIFEFIDKVSLERKKL